MDETLEFIWTAEDFEDLIADQLCQQYDCLNDEIIVDPDLDVWSFLEGWMAIQDEGGKDVAGLASSS